MLTLLTSLVLGWRRHRTNRFSCLKRSIIRNCFPFYRKRRRAGLVRNPRVQPKTSGGFRITNVHRDYRKGEGDKAPTAAISILDSVANPDYVSATTAAWNSNSESSEGYGKSVTIDGNPGFETFEKESKHATLWVMIANRYFVQVELQNQDPSELHEWAKRVDLKKLSEIK